MQLAALHPRTSLHARKDAAPDVKAIAIPVQTQAAILRYVHRNYGFVTKVIVTDITEPTSLRPRQCRNLGEGRRRTSPRGLLAPETIFSLPVIGSATQVWSHEEKLCINCCRFTPLPRLPSPSLM
jgi:hypothetical protein